MFRPTTASSRRESTASTAANARSRCTN